MNLFEGSRRLIRVTQFAIAAGTILIGGYYVNEAGTISSNDMDVVYAAIGWIVGIEVFARAVGWIIRGFKDIPTGQDVRNGATSNVPEHEEMESKE